MIVEIADRDATRLDNKAMAEDKNKMDKERMRFGMKVKVDTNRMNEEIRKLTYEVNNSIDQLTKCNIQIKQLTTEQQKMKQRIVKLKSRKGKVD